VGFQNRSGRGGEEKNSKPLPGLEPPIIQRHTTELSRIPMYGRQEYMNSLNVWFANVMSEVWTYSSKETFKTRSCRL